MLQHQLRMYPQDLPVLSCAFNFTVNITLNRTFESVNRRLENSYYQIIPTCEGSVGAISKLILQAHSVYESDTAPTSQSTLYTL